MTTESPAFAPPQFTIDAPSAAKFAPQSAYDVHSYVSENVSFSTSFPPTDSYDRVSSGRLPTACLLPPCSTASATRS